MGEPGETGCLLARIRPRIAAQPPNSMPPRASQASRSRLTDGGPRGEGRAWLVLGAAFAPGLLAGTQLSGLLFFLNPDLPFEPQTIGRALVIYGLLLGLVSSLMLLPFTWGRPRRAARLLPWSLTAVLGLAAAVHWSHASRFAFLLPPGMNVRLLKAGLWLTLGALICFYTALLHALDHRSYGRRSRLLLALVALAAVYVVVERREAFRPRPAPTPLGSAVEVQPRPSLLVVGLGTATLDAVLPLAEQGRLPFFARLVREGAYGHLSTFTPTLPEPLWTTLTTGKLPYRHGILSRFEHDAPLLVAGGELKLLPDWMGFSQWGLLGSDTRRVDARRLTASPLWTILPRLGVATGVVGWPVTDPPPARAVFAFSDRFFESEHGPRSALPAELAERGLLFRVKPDEIDPELRATFGPGAPAPIFAALARDVWRGSLTLFLTDQRRDARALFVVLPGLGEVSRRYFGGFSAVEFEGTQEPEALLAAEWVTAYYRYLDDLLSRLWERQPEPRLLAVVSAYGVKPPSGARRLWGEIVGRPAVAGYTDRAPDGMLLVAGSGVRAGTLVNGADLADVAPTLLYGLGFPIARDLDGQVLTSVFESKFLARHPLLFVPSYETLAEPHGVTAEPGDSDLAVVFKALP